jgi:hypothetical protein
LSGKTITASEVNVQVYRQNIREIIIATVNRMPGVEAFGYKNMIRIKCLQCGDLIAFDNGVALTALTLEAAKKYTVADNMRFSVENFAAYVESCILKHVCSGIWDEDTWGSDIPE